MSRVITCSCAGLLGLMLAVGCDYPECIDGPSNLTAENVAECSAAPDGVADESQIASAGAELRNDGTLVLTFSSLGLTCGTEAADVQLPEDCALTGWALTAEIPAALALPGNIIDLATHPEVLGTLTALNGADGGSRGTIGDQPFFVGELELLDVGDACVTGVLHGFGTGSPDPTLGGPELDGFFVAPRC